jgi:type IV pilus assembly protein PilA
MKMKRLGKRGFTLVEIMIVVAIIALLAAIAIPNLLRARHNANEAAAIASLRTISTACESFRAAQTPAEYPDDLAELGDADPPYIDDTLAGGTKQGYTFTYAPVAISGRNYKYTCIANPIDTGTTGTRVFFVDETGVIRLTNAAGVPID